MVEVKWLESDIEFIHLIPLVAQFARESMTPFWKNVGEVSRGFINPTSFTLLVLNEGEVVGYLHGYFTSLNEFMISQALNRGGEDVNRRALTMMEEKVKAIGGVKVMLLTSLSVGVFEKYGFTFEKTLMSKKL